jgi:hypothetical protein
MRLTPTRRRTITADHEAAGSQAELGAERERLTERFALM